MNQPNQMDSISGSQVRRLLHALSLGEVKIDTVERIADMVGPYYEVYCSVPDNDYVCSFQIGLMPAALGLTDED